VMVVAFLGAGGTMGFGMARNIAVAGEHVRAWDRSPEKARPLAEHGVEILDTPREAASGASVLVTMLPDADAVLGVMQGRDGALSEAGQDLVWAQMSTIGVDGTERCAALAEERGVAFVDAPVQGTKQPAAEGKLVVLASGPAEARERVGPLFDAVGQKTVWLGEAGAGTRMKMVTNSWLVSVVEGLAEALALAEAAGLDPKDFLEVVSGGPLDMPYMQMKARAMIEHDFEPSFKLSLAAKDARLAVELAQRLGLDLPMLRAIRDRLAEGAERHGEADVAATFLTSAPSRDRS
jgi:3-hydroxyisobutyrate dehydrogenase